MVKRQPRGTRTGGQFATDARSDDIDDLEPIRSNRRVRNFDHLAEAFTEQTDWGDLDTQYDKQSSSVIVSHHGASAAVRLDPTDADTLDREHVLTSARNRVTADLVHYTDEYAAKARTMIDHIDQIAVRTDTPPPLPRLSDLEHVQGCAGHREIDDQVATRLISSIPTDPHAGEDAALRHVADGSWDRDRLVDNTFGEGDDFRDALHRHYGTIAGGDSRQMDVYSALGTWSMNR